MNYGWEIAKIVFYLFLVVGIIFLVTKLLKKGMIHTQQGKYMKVIEQLYIAPERFLSLVEINDQIILLAISNERIEQIKEWSKDEFEELEISRADSSIQGFKGYLQQFLKNNRCDKSEE